MAKKNMDMMESGAKVKLGVSDVIIRGFGYVFITLYAVCCIVPFIIIISTSFTDQSVIRTQGAQLIPKQFTLQAYEMVCGSGSIWWSYLLTIALTVVGTTVGLSIIAMTGYALQRKDFPFRNAISFYIYFTTLFSAGLAPYYLLMVQTYHLKDNYLAVLLPLMMSSWLIILMKNFVKAIPHEITESGKIDGAGDFSKTAAVYFIRGGKQDRRAQKLGGGAVHQSDRCPAGQRENGERSVGYGTDRISVSVCAEVFHQRYYRWCGEGLMPGSCRVQYKLI